MKKHFYLCFLFFTIKFLAQDKIDLSPNTYSLQQVNHPSSNEFRGLVDISVPLYTLETNSGFNLPINLKYYSGGVKVDDYGSNVGVNWNLSGNGVIIRKAFGRPDEMTDHSIPIYIYYSEPGYTIDCNATGSYYNVGWFSSKQTILDNINYRVNNPLNSDILYGPNVSPDWFSASRSTDFLIFPNEGKMGFTSLDKGPDEFQVFLPDGRFFTFFFNDELKPVVTNSLNYKIINSNSDINGIINFTVIDDEGTEYLFSDREMSYLEFPAPSINSPYNSLVRGTGSSFPSTEVINRYDLWRICTGNEASAPLAKREYTNAWYLTKITTKLQEVINYQYEDRFVYNIEKAPYANSINYTTKKAKFLMSFSDMKTGSSSFNLAKFKEIIKIQSENATIHFNYGGKREDIIANSSLSTVRKLNELIVETKFSKIAKKYIFKQTYVKSVLDGNNRAESEIDQAVLKRLYLDEVVEINPSNLVQEKNRYKFEYYNRDLLPNKQSFKMDYWGFYKKIITGNLFFLPDLWHYPEGNIENQDKSKFSIYPRTLQDEPSRRIEGNYPIIEWSNSQNQYIPSQVTGFFQDRRPSTDEIKYGSLVKVTYPTGAELNLEYENNTFKYYDIERFGSGIRIKKTSLKEGLNNYVKIYGYPSVNNEISGRVLEVPEFTREYDTKVSYLNPDRVELERFYSICNYPVYQRGNENFNVMYRFASIEEINNGVSNGKILKEFYVPFESGVFQKQLASNYNYLSSAKLNVSLWKTTSSDFNRPNFIIKSGDYHPYFAESDFRNLNGRIISETICDKNNIALKKTEYGYDDYITDFKRINLYGSPEYLSGGTDRLLIINSKLKTIKTTDFLGNGSQTIIKNFEYDSKNYIKKIFENDSKGNTYVTEFLRPSDLTVSVNSPEEKLISSNQLKTVLEKTLSLNGKVVEKSKNTFVNKLIGKTKLEGANVVPEFSPLISSIENSKDGITFYNTKKYNYVDNTNVPVEIYKEGNSKTALIWGYNKKCIIAKLENIDFSAINSSVVTNLQSLSNLDNDNCKTSSCKEEQLRLALNNLRASYPKAMITTYTHDPLIGLTSVTNPRGEVMYYEYDHDNRLKSVRDYLGNIISENEYNYKN
ncbi:hypothetical protein [Flavobacterium sp. GCM10027622]|uniref:hypothetical protein n=1 Tax=unclassified Flavobacterium TaxID=196869 RepID=UPI00360ED374